MDKISDFEKKMQALSDITEKLEKGELSLSESMKAFEEGVRLTKECTDMLNSAKQKILKITTDSSGNEKEEDFDSGVTDEL